MDYNLFDNIQYCGEYIANISDILLYSHIPPAGAAFLLALFVFLKNRQHILSRTLVILSLLFSVWVTLNLTIWFTYDRSSLLMFAWSQIEVFSTLLFIYSFFFCYEYIREIQVPILYRVGMLLPVVPIILLSTSNYLTTYDAQECIAVESAFYSEYVLIIKTLYALATLALLIFAFITRKKQRVELSILAVGILSFLYTFLFAGFISEQTDNYTYELYGLFPMFLFIGSLAYLMVRFTAFNIRMVGANVLIIVLIALVGSQIFSFTTYTDLIIDCATTLLVIAFGLMLLHSVRQEIRQRQELENLTKKLEKANKRLKSLDQMKSEFVSIASHQLRSPLTSIRGYASMLLEGSFGKLSPKAKDAIERISDSSHFMAESVEDYLNVSRIQAGNMKYELMDFNIKTEASHVVDDIRQQALKKGLLLTFKSDLTKQGIVYADIGKTKQILHNLINNSLKYTPKGKITVFVHDNVKKKKVYVDIIDTGIGMSEETLGDVFAKFERAHNANEVNVTGTGLGLFIARKIARDMQGDVYATSEGEGKGSVFTLELPLKM